MKHEQLIRQIREDAQLGAPGSDAVGTWFLGPVGENKKLLRRLVGRLAHEHSVGRRFVYPNDPPWIDTTTEDHRLGAEMLERELLALMRRLFRYSVPWYSYRYHAHMNWDNTLPSVVGYFGALLYNQNNVAPEGSPVTTALEIEVARDLCRMIGYPPPGSSDVEPWAHITCDGSVANIEAMWAMRNVKLYSFAAQSALRSGLEKYDAFEVGVTGGGRKRLVDLGGWELLNLTVEETLAIPTRLKDEEKATDEELRHIDGFSVQKLGLCAVSRTFADAHPRFANAIDHLAFLAPATCHYSIPKGATLLGLGKQSVLLVSVDSNARLDVSHLDTILEDRLQKKRPIAGVIAVLGTTQESAVDPLRDILQLREGFRGRGFDFAVHVDAAWGGYFAAMLREPHPASAASQRLERAMSAIGRAESADDTDDTWGPNVAYHQLSNGADIGAPARDRLHERMVFTAEMGMSRYVRSQLEMMPSADSVTVDPHKAGFAPYPAGAICYRDRRMPEMVMITAPIVYRGSEDPSVGVFGIEGSKPGAAAAGVWLSHRLIRPDQSGYGRILGRCLLNAMRMFAALASLESDLFEIATLQVVRSNEKNMLRALSALDNRDLWNELRTDAAKAELFQRAGPDMNISTFALNLRLKNGELNDNADLANELNRQVYERLSLEYEGDAWPPVLITGSEYDPAVTGETFVNEFRARLGIDASPKPMQYLVSTTANPWLTDAGGGTINMIPVIMKHLKNVIEVEARRLQH